MGVRWDKFVGGVRKVGGYGKTALGYTFNNKVTRGGLYTAAIGTAAIAAPMAISAIRSSRTASDDLPLPPAPDLAAPLPQVLEAPDMMNTAPGMDQGQTLMGQPLNYNGSFGERVKMGRSGGQQIDTSSPSIIRPDGRNAIDGSQGVQALINPATGGGRQY